MDDSTISLEADTITLPLETAVIRPFASIVAIAGLLMVYDVPVLPDVMFAVLLSGNVAVTVSCAMSPTEFRVALFEAMPNEIGT